MIKSREFNSKWSRQRKYNIKNSKKLVEKRRVENHLRYLKNKFKNLSLEG